MELLPSLLDNNTHCRITRALRKWAGSWNFGSRFPAFLWKCAHYFGREGEMLALRLWFNQVDDGEGKRQANGKPLGRVFAGDCSHQSHGCVWFQCFPEQKTWWWDGWEGQAPCPRSFVGAGSDTVIWANWNLLALAPLVYLYCSQECSCCKKPWRHQWGLWYLLLQSLDKFSLNLWLIKNKKQVWLLSSSWFLIAVDCMSIKIWQPKGKQ